MVFQHFNFYKGRNKNAKNYLKVSGRKVCPGVSYFRQQSGVRRLGASPDDDNDSGGHGEGGAATDCGLSVLPALT